VREETTPAPHRVDVHVGARVRILRRASGMSQEALADRLGLTFQQVHNYERGANRISASKLFEIAAALNVPVSSFFEGLRQVDDAGASRTVNDIFARLMEDDEGAALAELFPQIRSAQVRRTLVRMVRALVADQSDG
jgi:transcriptional regulator with XRE-family HTH domain